MNLLPVSPHVLASTKGWLIWSRHISKTLLTSCTKFIGSDYSIFHGLIKLPLCFFLKVKCDHDCTLISKLFTRITIKFSHVRTVSKKRFFDLWYMKYIVNLQRQRFTNFEVAINFNRLHNWFGIQVLLCNCI